MARVPAIDMDALSGEQGRLADEIAGARSGQVRGPFAIWLRIPRIAEKANEFGNVLRRGGQLDRRLFELMVLIVARRWSAQYEWYAHEKNALAAGVSPDVIDAIRARQIPNFAHDDEKLVYEIVTEIDDTRNLSAQAYERAVGAFGLDVVIELVTAIGFYSSVAMMINVFEAPVPGDERPLP